MGVGRDIGDSVFYGGRGEMKPRVNEVRDDIRYGPKRPLAIPDPGVIWKNPYPKGTQQAQDYSRRVVREAKEARERRL